MGIPWAPVTASDVRMNPYTIQGWRPTSVVTQPAISATAESDRAIEPARLGQAALPEANVKEDEPEERQQRPDAHHGLKREPHDIHRRPVGGRHGLQSLDGRVRIVEREQRQESRDLDPVYDLV